MICVILGFLNLRSSLRKLNFNVASIVAVFVYSAQQGLSTKVGGGITTARGRVLWDVSSLDDSQSAECSPCAQCTAWFLQFPQHQIVRK